MSRCDRLPAANVTMECCRFTLSVFIASLCNIRRTQRNPHFRWPVLNYPSLAGFNCPLTSKASTSQNLEQSFSFRRRAGDGHLNFPSLGHTRNLLHRDTYPRERTTRSRRGSGRGGSVKARSAGVAWRAGSGSQWRPHSGFQDHGQNASPILSGTSTRSSNFFVFGAVPRCHGSQRVGRRTAPPGQTETAQARRHRRATDDRAAADAVIQAD